MEHANLKPDATKDVRDILRERREMLDRVRSNLKTVDDLQKQFAIENGHKNRTVKFPATRLRDVCIPNVRMISINELSISVLLSDHEAVTITYPSHEAFTEDLNAWSNSASSEALSKLNVPPPTSDK